MTRDAAVTLMMGRLGQRVGLEAQLISELQLAQSRLEGGELMPWFLETSGTINTVANQNWVAVPTGFIRETDDRGTWITGSDGEYSELKKDDYQWLKGAYAGQNPGKPLGYALVGAKLYLFPTPDAIYPIEFWYFSVDTVLSTNIENAWLKYSPDLLIGTAGIAMAGFLRDQGAIALFSGQESEARASVERENATRMVANRDLTMGG